MVSNENRPGRERRPYRLKARAQRRAEVHRRITEAAVELHRTIGPARTTMGEIAKRAGVRRATVYNHFTTDLELIDACSAHWVAQNPPPDPAGWAAVTDPARRVETALTAMYAYYASGRDMLERVLRDAPQVPALEEINRRKWWPMLEALVGLLAEGWNGGTELRATLWVALDFFTWQTLARSGLSAEEAARLATSWVVASGQR